MNYGLYLSAAGALNSLHRQDVYANNLANADTVGFKPDAAMARQRLPERLETGGLAAVADPNVLIERLGGGLLGDPTRVMLGQGDLTATGNDLDVAIRGEGFLVTGDDRGGPLRLTRDGRLVLDQRGRLVTASGGRAVLDVENRPIVLDRSAGVAINGAGELIQNDRVVARLQLSRPTDPGALHKIGHNLLTVDGAAENGLTAAAGEFVSGHVETSGTDPILTLHDMITASKAVQANAKMMQYHDHVMGMAVNTFGRIA